MMTIIILSILTVGVSSTSINPLTRAQANNLYCLVDGSNCVSSGANSTPNPSYDSVTVDDWKAQSGSVTVEKATPPSGIRACTGSDVDVSIETDERLFGDLCSVRDASGSQNTVYVEDNDAICWIFGNCFDGYTNLTYYAPSGISWSSSALDRVSDVLSTGTANEFQPYTCSYDANFQYSLVFSGHATNTDCMINATLWDGITDGYVEFGGDDPKYLTFLNNVSNDLIWYDAQNSNTLMLFDYDNNFTSFFTDVIIGGCNINANSSLYVCDGHTTSAPDWAARSSVEFKKNIRELTNTDLLNNDIKVYTYERLGETKSRTGLTYEDPTTPDIIKDNSSKSINIYSLASLTLAKFQKFKADVFNGDVVLKSSNGFTGSCRQDQRLVFQNGIMVGCQ